MLRLCICDDDEKLCESLKNMLIEYSFQRNIDFEIAILHDTGPLLSDDIAYDILFLDIRFYDQDKGIDVAQELRMKGNNAFIVFMTTLACYLPDGYKARAFRYLIKPIREDRLYEAMDAIYKQLVVTDRYHARLAIKVGSESEVVGLSEIIAIESTATTRRRHILMPERELITKEPLGSLFDRLPHDLFVHVHQRYIVNISHVKRFSRTSVFLAGDIEVPLGRKYRDEFVSFFTRYAKKAI